jgi:hypothetical protein
MLSSIDRDVRDAGLEGEQLAAEVAPPVERPAGFDLHLRAARRGEVLLPGQHAVEPRRRDLQAVAAREGFVGVEASSDLPRHVGAAPDRHAAIPDRRVDDDAHERTPGTRQDLGIDQLQLVAGQDRLDDLAQTRRDVPVHRVHLGNDASFSLRDGSAR